MDTDQWSVQTKILRGTLDALQIPLVAPMPIVAPEPSLDQRRRSIVQCAADRFEIQDELEFEGHRTIQSWDNDGPDVVLVSFTTCQPGDEHRNLVDKVSLHVHFKPTTDFVTETYGYLVAHGGEIGTISPSFLDEERVRHEQSVLRQTLDALPANPLPARRAARL